MLWPRVKEKGENNNTLPYLARNEKFRLYGFLVYNAVIFHVYNPAVVSRERAFLEVGSPATVAWFAPCRADQLFLGVRETSRSYLQRPSCRREVSLLRRKTPLEKKAYGCVTVITSPLPELVCPGHSGLEKMAGVLSQ